MKGNTFFCTECRKEVQYRTEEVKETAVLKGQEYAFDSTNAYCNECNEQLMVPKIEDRNLTNLYDTYRQKNDIISLEDIRSIPEKYQIGVRPLSQLLGWGEHTFNRYYKGDMPSKRYSDELKNILNDPKYYLAIVEENKERLASETAYIKTKETTEKIINSATPSGQMISNVCKYILSRMNDMTNLALQKSLYYIQGFSYALNGRYMFEEECEAWVHGPVYREMYLEYRDFFCNSNESIPEPDLSTFKTDEINLLDSIIKYICCYSGTTLESFTHMEAPWVNTRGDLSPTENTDRIIPKDAIGEYFVSVKEKYNMLSPANIKSYADDLFTAI